MEDLESHVYWEIQPLGESTCGIHALNCIFQGPLFRLSEFEAFAEECKAVERDFLIQAGVSQGECDQMVSSSSKGNFDITVLEKALESKGCDCKRLAAENITESLDDHRNAFLLNVSRHWVSVRNVHGKWLVFDSKKERPEAVELVDSLKEKASNNHTVFLVKEKSGKFFPLFNHEKSVLTSNQKLERLEVTLS